MTSGYRYWVLPLLFFFLGSCALARSNETDQFQAIVKESRDIIAPIALYQQNRVFVDVWVKGEKVAALVDTGASSTVIDSQFAERMGLTANGTIEARGAGGVGEGSVLENFDMVLGGAEIGELRPIVLNLSAIEAGLGREVPLILGKDIFERYIVTFDWPNEALIFSDPNNYSYKEDATILPLGTIGELRSIPVSVQGFPSQHAIVDLGNPGALSLPLEYWRSKPSLRGLDYATWQFGGYGGNQPARMVTVDSIELGGHKLENVPVMLSLYEPVDYSEEINIGFDILRRFVFSIDYSRGNLILEKKIESIQGFHRNRVGIKTERVESGLLIIFVSPESPAFEAGVREGMIIENIDGHVVSASTYERSFADWSEKSDEAGVLLHFSDGSDIRVFPRDFY